MSDKPEPLAPLSRYQGHHADLVIIDGPLARHPALEPTVEFLRYPDGTLRLFKPGQYLGEEPAGYAENNVVVKARVIYPGRDAYVVILPATRMALDHPQAEDYLIHLALEWKR